MAAILSGICVAWLFWLGLGQMQLALVKSNILQTGYSFTPPLNPPRLPDEQNGVYYLRRAAMAESAKTWLAPTMTLDGPVQPEDDPKAPWNQPFYKKLSENEFLSDFKTSIADQTLTPEKMAYARKLLREHSESLALIHQAALTGNFDWGQDFGVPWFGKVKLPRIAFLLFLARLSACEAYVQARDGQYEKSLESLKDGFAIAEASRNSRFLISEMIGEAIPKMLLDVVRVMPAVPPSLLEKQLLPALQPWETGTRFPDTLNFEFFIMHGSLNQMSWRDLADYFQLADDYTDTKGAGLSNQVKGFFYRPFLEWDMASDLTYALQLTNGLQLPFQERKAFFEKTGVKFQKKCWAIGGSGFTWNGFYNMQAKADECVADCRLAHAAVEARLFHDKNKHWPDALWELEDEKNKSEFLDPFNDGADLKVMRYGDGILIYSLGPSGVDNQGRPKNLSTNDYINIDLRWILNK